MMERITIYNMENKLPI